MDETIYSLEDCLNTNDVSVFITVGIIPIIKL